ncbi:hypothetical protein B7C42_08338 [Nocardia cerradoensis]|uniref:Uncharacterized protein n=1 Tax=Nocardia cerradoensis TaxID=85688 RepID=A0A231GSK0_9NOCA|nr:hypothetical protein B7C42_08338 [Nocardia cerradoensis]
MVVAEAGGVGLAVVRAVPVLHGAGELAHFLPADLVVVANLKASSGQPSRLTDSSGFRLRHRLFPRHDPGHVTGVSDQ